MKFPKITLYLLPLLVLVIVISLPLVRAGFIPTHDGEYHLIRFWEFEKMLRAGNFFPRWAADLNSGYGVPLFNFHYPLPNYFGALFHSLGFSLADSLKLVLATGYVAAVILSFFWLAQFFSPLIALVGSVVSACVPYWFVDIYIRGSVGEVLGMAWVMLSLLAIEKNWALILGLSIGLLILTHNIIAMIFLPIILGYLLLRRPRIYPAMLTGLGIATYFWLPALVEQKFVTGLNPVNYLDYFPQLDQLLIPSWGSGFSSGSFTGHEMSPQIGLVPLAVILGILIMLRKNKKDKLHKLVYFFLGVTAMAIFLLLPLSQPLWKMIFVLPLVQYPWRFLSILVVTVAFFASYLTLKLGKVWLGIIIAILALALSFSYTRPAIYQPRPDSYYLSRPEFTDGTSSLGNTFSTKWTGWISQRPETKIEIVQGEGVISDLIEKSLSYEFSLRSPTLSTVRVNTVYYPGWKLIIDGQIKPIDYLSDGIIKFQIAAGIHQVRLVFEETPLRFIADLISLLSLFWLILSTILRKVYARH